jgi:hypothetical protein
VVQHTIDQIEDSGPRHSKSKFASEGEDKLSPISGDETLILESPTAEGNQERGMAAAINSPLPRPYSAWFLTFKMMNRESADTIADDRENGTKEGYLAAAALYTGEIVVSQETLNEWNEMTSEDKVKFEKRLLRKLDLRLVPWLCLLYLLSFLDRTNIGNAKIQGVRSMQVCA